jgi:hypothetical protein
MSFVMVFLIIGLEPGGRKRHRYEECSAHKSSRQTRFDHGPYP